MPQNPNLPEGFVLDTNQTAAPASLPTATPPQTPPPGFVLDQPNSLPTTSAVTPPSGFKLDSPGAGTAAPEQPQSWYGKLWQGANTPLVDFHKLLDTPGQEQSGFAGGLEDVASGLTSPLSVALTVGTLGGGAALRALGFAAEEVPVALRAVKGLVDAGFTVQNALGAIETSPKVFDAIKQGDTELAKRLAVHAIAGGTMAAFGGKMALKDAAPIVDSVLERGKFQIKPSEENLKVQKVELARQRLEKEYGDEGVALAKAIQEAKYKGMSPDEISATFFAHQSGLDPRIAADWHNAVAESAGRPEAKIAGGTPKPPEFSLGEPKDKTYYDPASGDIPGKSYPIIKDGTPLGVLEVSKKGKTANIHWMGAEDSETPAAPISNEIGPSGISQLVRQFKKENPEIEEIKGIRIGGARYGELRPEQTIPIEKLIGKEDTRLADLNRQAAKGLVKENYTPEEIDKLLPILKQAAEPTEKMRVLSSILKDKFGDFWTLANNHGIVNSAVDDYITQQWKPEEVDSNPAVTRLRADLHGPEMDVNFARKRAYNNAIEGILNGRKLRTMDPSSLLGDYITKVGRAIANRQAEEQLFKVRASDGRPLLHIAGHGKEVEGRDIDPNTGEMVPNGKPAMMVNPNTIRGKYIPKAELDILKSAPSIFDKFIEDGKIVELKDGKYAWNTKDYRELASNRMKETHFVASAPDGTPIFVKAPVVAHPEAYEYINRLFGGEKSPVKEITPLNWLLKGSAQAKALMLSFSPFHIGQEGLRGIMTGVSPWGAVAEDINANPELGRLYEGGMTSGKNYRNYHDFNPTEEGVGGHSKVIDMVGNLGDRLGAAGKPLSWARDIQNGMTSFLFDRYMPALKQRIGLRLLERWDTRLQDDAFFSRLQKQHPEFKGMNRADVAARLAGTEANERVGGLNYRALGRAAGTQDFLRLSTLAPDWLESEIRSAHRLFDPTGGVMARQDFARMVAYTWLTARVLNMFLNNGKMHNEAPFGVAWTDPDGKEKIYSVRTLPTDMFHAITDPVDFLRGRASPLVRTTAEGFSGRDFQGRKLTPKDTFVDIMRNNYIPIPGQAFLKGATGGNPELTNFDQAIKAGGATATVYKTEAQKLAYELSSNKNETGPVDESQLARHRAVIDLENRVRSGQATVQDLNTLVEQGHISQKEAKTVQKNVIDTHGMDPEMAGLYTRASRLPAPDFLKIWDAATPNEQAVLAKLLMKKRTAYNTRALKEMTPEQRAKDPTYQRLKAIFPGQPVF